MTERGTVTIGGRVVLAGAAQHPHAARRLREALPRLDLVPEGDGLPRITLAEDASRAEGAFALSVGPAEIAVSGGPFSGVIYGVEELIAAARPQDGGYRLPAGERRAAPGLAHRAWWTWDHSTNWELSQIGHQEIGVFNPYGKPPEGFLADYKRAVDFASRNRIAAIIIYGFLRDSHGGIEAAQELCRYARERGVRIMPGIAIGAYGGVYWEGDHRFNLASWLHANPAFAATLEKGIGFQIQDLDFPLSFPRSDYTLSACPSRPETMDWMTDAVAWLAETFAIGGINIESGDYGVCGCARCNARRAAREDGSRRAGDAESWSHADMADNFPRLFEAASARRDDLWLYCELQWDNLLDPAAHEALAAMPSGGIYQHTVNRSYWAKLREGLSRADVERLPTQPNILRCQFASQWNGDRRTERYAFNAKAFADMATTGAALGMKGLTVWGEASPYHATVELGYRAFARFSYDPSLTWDAFMAEDAAPMLGGTAEAERFVAVAEELDANVELPAERLKTLSAMAHEAGAGAREDAVARRWLSLEDQIARRRFMGR
ncbi:hypothetical protein [Prosthecomicrobium pneumaticum]|uniref:Uncharacterized protein n=1 Tax=Prosthecomicrobium pneumaticum TaxID=81895 RepID=A0A7W9L2A8_9HYPH|nr:hypothetical protein [Prosthecomicrobium pneumaticum]MBB5753410.1 hypothetical protein [Prosthecomicrobium pneumaticum]